MLRLRRRLAASSTFLLSVSGGLVDAFPRTSNVVQYVTTADGQKFVLRCYNNGNNTARVRFEHAVLSAVRALGPLSFALPEALPSLSGETTVPLANGAQACLFTLIPGTLPKLSAVKSIGAASGELSTALARVSVVMASPTAPYHDLYAVHHAVSQDSFFKAMAASDFDGVRTASDYLVAEVKAIEASIDACKRLQLPEQLIHGDLQCVPLRQPRTRASSLIIQSHYFSYSRLTHAPAVTIMSCALMDESQGCWISSFARWTFGQWSWRSACRNTWANRRRCRTSSSSLKATHRKRSLLLPRLKPCPS